MADSSVPSDEAVFLSHLSALLSTNRKISVIVDEKPSLKDQLGDFDPLRSVALVAGPTEPSLHANTIRIELVVHLLLAFAAGHRKPGRR